MLRRCARLNGVSRTINTRRRRSLSVTSAARVNRLSDRTHGPSAAKRLHRTRRDDHRLDVAKLPLAIACADISRVRMRMIGHETSSSRRSRPNSWWTLSTPAGRGHQMGRHAQRFAQPVRAAASRIDCAGRAGDADDQALSHLGAHALSRGFSTCCSSPLWYISIIMSEPPTNSPLT